MSKGTCMDFMLHHMLRKSAFLFPEKEMLIHGDQRLTYREVARRTAGLAYGLHCAGLQRGDRIGIYLEPSVAQALSIFGVSQAGGVFVPINSLLLPGQVAHVVRDCRMKGLITTRSKLSFLTNVLKDIPSVEFAVVLADSASPDVSLPV